jgi:hypothetical protein
VTVVNFSLPEKEEEMKKFSGFHMIVLLVIASIVLTACGGQAASATHASTEAPAATEGDATALHEQVWTEFKGEQ